MNFYNMYDHRGNFLIEIEAFTRDTALHLAITRYDIKNVHIVKRTKYSKRDKQQ